MPGLQGRPEHLDHDIGGLPQCLGPALSRERAGVSLVPGADDVFLGGGSQEPAEHRDEGIPVRPAERQEPESGLHFHFHMVEHPGAQLRLLSPGAGEQRVVYDERILPVRCREAAECPVDDPLGDGADETFPVRPRRVQEAVDGVFAEVLVEAAGVGLHIHAPVAEHEAQQVAENIERGMPLLLLRMARLQESGKFVIVEEFFQGSAYLPLFILIRFGYSGHGRITPFWCFGTFIIPYLGGFCLILYGSILFLHVGSLRIIFLPLLAKYKKMIEEDSNLKTKAFDAAVSRITDFGYKKDYAVNIVRKALEQHSSDGLSKMFDSILTNLNKLKKNEYFEGIPKYELPPKGIQKLAFQLANS